MRGTAGPSAPLRFGRDDNSVWTVRVCYGELGRAEGRTADPSASLGMTKGRAGSSVELGLWMRGTAGPSASLRSGRDDNSVWVVRVCYGELGRADGAHCRSLGFARDDKAEWLPGEVCFKGRLGDRRLVLRR